MKQVFLLILLSFTLFNLNAQTKVLYDDTFEFTEGIYLNKEAFQHNNPIEKSNIITYIDQDDLAFFDKLVEENTISVLDNIGNKIEIKTNSIWGYCSGGTIFINYNGFFNRVGIIGSICHFLGTKTYINSARYPYNVGYYHSYGYYGPTYSQTTESQQYFLNFNTGEITEYTVSNLLSLLMSDPELHDEYSELPKKKKQSKLFYYMRKFNERHPLYITLNQ
ncbi:MAG: hypothetical protein MJ211_03135 [Bacteroidales bacterium]|nr:hypothetical protein [Bacteroidales bacterium]